VCIQKTSAYVSSILELYHLESPHARHLLILNLYLVFPFCLTPVFRFDTTMKTLMVTTTITERKGGFFIPVAMNRSVADKLRCLDSIFPLLRSTHIVDVPRGMLARNGIEKRSR
jgi:hypothetical protein